MKRYLPSKDVETYLSLLVAGIVTITAVVSSSYATLIAYQELIQPFLLTIIGGAMSILGLSISGVAIVISMFSARDVDLIDKLRENAFEELLTDFKFLAFHISSGIILLSLIYFREVVVLPLGLAKIGTYLCLFYVTHFLAFTVLYSAALVGNCIKLSKLKQTLYSVQKIEKGIYETINEMVSERLVVIAGKTHGFTLKEFYEDLIQSIEKSDLENKDVIADYLKKRYQL